ncbi:MAG: hypothetical protein AMXMBFR82_54010 [Candidatus Hydrogenedentota bacterium]
MHDLGTLGGQHATAQAVSADGLVVVGWSHNAVGNVRAFRWTASEGMTEIGALGGPHSVAYGVSADGSVIVGYAMDMAGLYRAFRWRDSLSEIDGSGFVDTDDFDAFVGAFEAGAMSADVDGSSFVDLDDFTAFVLAFEAGC